MASKYRVLLRKLLLGMFLALLFALSALFPWGAVVALFGFACWIGLCRFFEAWPWSLYAVLFACGISDG